MASRRHADAAVRGTDPYGACRRRGTATRRWPTIERVPCDHASGGPCGGRWCIPPFVRDPDHVAATTTVAAEVASVVLPALLAEHLRGIAREHHAACPSGPSEAKRVTQLGALVPRVMYPGSWAEAARHAGAEPLWTGRSRAYDASTLRQVATRLDAEGCSERVANVVWNQVERAVEAGGEEVIAYTDMFDPPYYTKKLAHAAPIGRLGNRILAATYFGLTTIALPQGPTLFAHLSWHKPAAPLGDGLEDRFAEDARLAWWHDHVRLHIVDRGANGDRILGWCLDWDVPYLTIGRQSADLWRFRTPTYQTARGKPIVVRPDTRLEGTASDGPWEVIVPANPDDPDATRGLRFRSAVECTADIVVELNAVYKSRWPSMENEIKALLSRGFGRNRTRKLELTTSRGVDGQLLRLDEREADLLAQIVTLNEEPVTRRNADKMRSMKRKVRKVRGLRARTQSGATLKHARPEGGAERLGKWLHLLTQNALALALYASNDPAIRSMSATKVFDLLLGQPAIARVAPDHLTLWVEAVGSAADRRLQESLVEVFNKLQLRSLGSLIEIRLRQTLTAKGL